jgi:glycosyltransferase involved in cell wall biosynthesis
MNPNTKETTDWQFSVFSNIKPKSGPFTVIASDQQGNQQGARICLGVVIPVFNEVGTIEHALGQVLAQFCVMEVIVVDDGSTDGTSFVVQAWTAKDARVTLIRHPANRGKGASIRTGLARVKAPIVIIQDADSEYDPSDYRWLIEPILQGRVDVVYGSRFMRGANPHTDKRHRLQNRLLTAFANLLTGLKLTDEATCYKVFRRELIERLDLQEDRFGFCPEFTVKVSRMGLMIKEVPISYRARSISEGKKLRFWDGVDAIRCLIKYSFICRNGFGNLSRGATTVEREGDQAATERRSDTHFFQ